MRTTRAWCVELQRTVSIAEVQNAYFGQPEPRRRFTFLCADEGCRSRAATRMTAVHEDRLYFDDAYPTSSHFVTVPQTPHDPLCEDVLRERASALVRNGGAAARGDLNASRRFSTKQAFEVFDVYWPSVAGVMSLSALLAPTDLDPQSSALAAMPARLQPTASLPTSQVPLVEALAAQAVAMSSRGQRARPQSDDDAIKALEQAIEAMAAGTPEDVDFDDGADPVPRRVAQLAETMRSQELTTRRLADVVACYSELGAVDRQKAMIRLPGGRAMPYGSFIQPLARYQDTDEPLVRVGGARVMREERGYVLRFFDRVVLDGERFEVVMRLSDARIAASSQSALLRAQLLACLGEGHHVRVFFFGGIAPDTRQHNLTQVRLSDLDNLVLQPMRVAGAGTGSTLSGQRARSVFTTTDAGTTRY